jgi:hypothetical protein
MSHSAQTTNGIGSPQSSGILVFKLNSLGWSTNGRGAPDDPEATALLSNSSANPSLARCELAGVQACAFSLTSECVVSTSAPGEASDAVLPGAADMAAFVRVIRAVNADLAEELHHKKLNPIPLLDALSVVVMLLGLICIFVYLGLGARYRNKSYRYRRSQCCSSTICCILRSFQRFRGCSWQNLGGSSKVNTLGCIARAAALNWLVYSCLHFCP